MFRCHHASPTAAHGRAARWFWRLMLFGPVLTLLVSYIYSRDLWFFRERLMELHVEMEGRAFSSPLAFQIIFSLACGAVLFRYRWRERRLSLVRVVVAFHRALGEWSVFLDSLRKYPAWRPWLHDLQHAAGLGAMSIESRPSPADAAYLALHCALAAYVT